jgi:hypothetical protein
MIQFYSKTERFFTKIVTTDFCQQALRTVTTYNQSWYPDPDLLSKIRDPDPDPVVKFWIQQKGPDGQH